VSDSDAEAEEDEEDVMEDEDDEDGEGLEDDEADEEGRGRSGDKAKSDAVPARVTAASRRNQALAAQISELEGDLMAEKPWELRGEVKAGDRPENSFLGLHADIER
jgi:U3 small nucleolar RNA-associated protein MPP10